MIHIIHIQLKLLCPTDVVSTVHLCPTGQSRFYQHALTKARDLALKDVVEIIKYHHEKHDGTGYPYGIKGEEIPIGSRIIAIADAFDSVISDRVYREKTDLCAALNKIKEASGTQFDPVIVKAFEDCFEAIEKIVKEDIKESIF